MLQEFGIRHQTTVKYSPEQNESIEREMRTVVEAARTMLHAKRLQKHLWAKAVNTAVCTLNKSGTSSINNKTPYELWYGRLPELNTLQTFGSEVFTHVPKQLRRKWDTKAKRESSLDTRKIRKAIEFITKQKGKWTLQET